MLQSSAELQNAEKKKREKKGNCHHILFEFQVAF